MTENNSTLKYRVGQLETAVDKLDHKIESYNDRIEKKVDKIIENHLPHIQDDMAELKLEITKNTVKIGVVFSVIFTVIQVIVDHFIH